MSGAVLTVVETQKPERTICGASMFVFWEEGVSGLGFRILVAPTPKIGTLSPAYDSHRVLFLGVGVTKILPLRLGSRISRAALC